MYILCGFKLKVKHFIPESDEKNQQTDEKNL